MANDIAVTYTLDPNPTVTRYNVVFTTTPATAQQANAPLTLSVPQSAAGDASGYSCHYTDLVGAPVLSTGDSVVVQGQSVSPTEVSPLLVAAGSPVVVPAAPTALAGPTGFAAAFVTS